MSFHGELNGYQVPQSQCNKKCEGDSTQQCGGSDVLNLYSITGADTFSDVRDKGLVPTCPADKTWSRFYKIANIREQSRVPKYVRF